MRSLVGLGVGLIVLCVSALAVADQPTDVQITLKGHRFVPAEIRVKRETKVRLVITNADVTVEEFESPALNREKLIPPGQTITILLRPLKPGVYEFFGEFNPKTATGRLVVD